MDYEQTPFPAGWWSFGLPAYRECEGTYGLFSYQALPPLDADVFRGEFQWLSPLSVDLDQVMSLYRPSEEEQRGQVIKLNDLLRSARLMSLKLPESFVRFMNRPEWQNRIPSCTACYFDLSEHIIKSKAGDEGYLIRFLNDQQWVLLWYLYLTPQGEHCVVVSPIPFDAPTLPDIAPEVIRQVTCFCGPDFEAFLYRFWLENHLWFALNEGRTLAEEQQHYLDHLTTGP